MQYEGQGAYDMWFVGMQAAMEAPGAKNGDVEAMAKAVAGHAQKQHTRDDVSVVVLRFSGSPFSFSQTNGSSHR